MNLNLYYNKFLFFILLSISFGKILTPESTSDCPEILIKNNVSREYYKIDRNGLEYSIKGPAEIKIFSKAALPKKRNHGINQFGFSISVNGINTKSNNLKKIDKKTFSSSHPMHLYTYSAKDIIVLPSGDFKMKFQKNSIFDEPILVRVSRVGRKSRTILKEEINFSNSSSNKHTIQSIHNTLMPQYYLLDREQSLFLGKTEDVNGLLEFNIRGMHFENSKESKIVKMNLIKDGKYNGRYHVFCIPHPSKTIIETNKIPSKLNKIYLQNNNHNYYLLSIEESDSKLLIRPNRMIR